MTFKDLTQSLLDMVKTGGGFGPKGGEANMPHGGSCGYHPNTARHRVTRDTTRQNPVADMPQNGAAGYTDFVPAQGTGYQQPMDQGQTGFQPPFTGYQPQVNQSQTGYQAPFTGYQPQVNDWTQTGYAQGAGQSFGNWGYQEPAMNGTGYVQPQGSSAPDNIRYMPNSFAGDDQQGYKHVERVALVTTIADCYRLIEFMRNSESVIVNVEQITDEAENQRCLDLLYGAAYTMQCSFTRIAACSIYLIAPSCVMVQPYHVIDRMSEQDIKNRWPGSQPQWEQPYREENRGFARSQNAFASSRGWQDAFTGYRAVGYGR